MKRVLIFVGTTSTVVGLFLVVVYGWFVVGEVDHRMEPPISRAPTELSEERDLVYSDTEYGVQLDSGQCPGIPQSFVKQVLVDSYDSFLEAYSQAQPGDAVVIRNGVYDWSAKVPKRSFVSYTERPLILDREGRADAPIYVVPETLHGVTFQNNDFSWVLDGKYNVFAGFRFVALSGRTVRVTGSDNRIACNYFEKSSRFVQVESQGADRTEIDNNEFKGSTGPALMLMRCKPTSSSCVDNSKEPHIHHNTWRDKAYAGSNGHEAIILGLGYAPIPGRTIYNPGDGVDGSNMLALIENNLFDAWNGENELISIKSSRNIIRNNCIRNSPVSGFKVRLGYDNLITGNWFENANHGGQEISGQRNHIVFNYWSHAPRSAVRFAAGTEYPDSDSMKNLMVYIAGSENVISHNIYGRLGEFITVEKYYGSSSTYRRAGMPENNRLENNVVRSANYKGSATSGGYFTKSDYSESDFRANNSWDALALSSDEPSASSCGNAALFQGPGGPNVTLQYTPSQDQSIGVKPPSWW